MLMKKMAALSLCLGAALLPGCGMANMSTDVDKLLRAPQIMGQTSDVQKALNNYLGESAQLKYPTSGENLSPFLFGDWDGNGTEDAAVLYTCNAKGQNVCLSILEKIGDAWQVTHEVEGLSTEVESVSLAAMDSSPAQQLLVGYTSSRGDQYLSVYAYQERTLHTVLQQSYEGWLLADVTGDGSDDLLLLLPPEQNESVQVSLLTNADGSFRLTQQLSVGQGVYTGCEALCAGTGTNGQPYLVLDGKVGSYLASSILIYDDSVGQMQVYNPPGYEDVYAATTRYNTALISRDLDGNGTVDIPSQKNGDSNINLAVEHRLSYVTWNDYTGGDQGNTQFGVLDGEYNFFLRLPLDWQGVILLDENPTHDGWRVLNAANGEQLLEIRILAMADSTQEEEYTRVAIIGRQQVCVKLNTEPDALTVQQVENGICIL